jgi:hypothetical protein
MEIQKVINYIPLIGPERFFIDIRGLPNSYSDTNPSIYIDENNYIIILIRQVNYRKFSNKQFVLDQNTSISKYVMMYGHNFNNLETSQIEYDWNNFPKYNTYWEGMEDIRFINKNLLLVTVPERNINGMPCIFLAELITEKITEKVTKIKLLNKLEPSNIEKNWMPFHYSDFDTNFDLYQNHQNLVIYSVSPFIIKSLYNDDRRLIPINNELVEKLQGYHGSTNGLNIHNMYQNQHDILFLIHKYETKTHHRWLKFNPQHNQVYLSEPFIFFTHSYIEFPCSLSWCNPDQQIVISLGVNDNKAYIVFIDPNTIVFS